MSNANVRRERLCRFMVEHSLSDAEVAGLVQRRSDYIAKLRRGVFTVTPALLRLLELELKHGRGQEFTRRAG